MAYTYNSAASNAAGLNTITLSPPSGSLIVVWSVTSAGGGTPTVTFSDNSSSIWVNASNNVSSGSNHYSVGYTLSAAAGVTTITATYNGGTPGSIALTAVAYTGLTSPSFIGLTAPNLQASPGAGTDAVTTSALNCGSTSALLVGLSADASGSNTGLVGGTGFTQRISTNNGGTWGIFIEDPDIEVTGSQTATWTASAHSTDTYDSVAVCFADNAGGGGTATIAWVT